MTYLLNCTNTGCDYNRVSRCALRQIVVDKNGRCMLATNRPTKKKSTSTVPSQYVTRTDLAKDLNIQVQLLSYHLTAQGIKHDERIKGKLCYKLSRVPEITNTIRNRLRKTDPTKYASEDDRRGKSP